MGILDEIKRLRQEGRGEQEIVQNLQQRGASRTDIEDAISQTQIKDAVTAPSGDFGLNLGNQNSPSQGQYDFEGEGKIPATNFNSLQPSLMTPQEDSPQDNLIVPVPSPSSGQEGEGYQPGDYAQGGGGYSQEGYQDSSVGQGYPPQETSGEGFAPQEGYPSEGYPEQGYGEQYAPQSSVSTDTITEIAEQIVMEKLSKIRGQLEKATEVKGGAEGKLSQLDERLQRIEKIIDRLQLSVLQKIGDYVTDVSDLKKEIVETQKSFKVLSGRKGHSGHSHEGAREHHVHHHSHAHEGHSEHHHSHPHAGHAEHHVQHKKHGKK